jgi:DNA repair protein RecN (Recombination protein N)
MLRQLSIRNLAVIDQLTLDFGTGFSVLTGETGAGKSILIDALGLVLGDRADPALVRAGEAQAEIAAEFDLSACPAAAAWLRDQAMENVDDPQTCLIRRVIFAEGRTRASINGAQATAGALRELGEQLVEIHGQNEHQSLLRAEAQRSLLDEFGKHGTALAAVAAAVRGYQECMQAIAALRAAAGREPAELDYLRHQLHELKALGLAEGELETLHAEHKRLAHAGKLLQDGAQAEALIYGGDNSLYDQLASVRNLIEVLTPLHEGFGEAESAIAEAQARAQEAARSIRSQLDQMDLDPERLAEVEQRMTAIHDLARKHRVRAEALPARLLELQESVDASEHAADKLTLLESQLGQLLDQYRDAARKLSVLREKSAADLGRKVAAVVRELGMAKAEFAVVVERKPETQPRQQGDDDIRFDFSANPGQPPRPLAKVASGGELSRLSLAIQVVANQKNAAATLIFDEVDAGIGGATAEIVGRKLRELSKGRQVLSVTHLPQVASQGQQHYAIRKLMRSGKTVTQVQSLKTAERVSELARMLGGQDLSAATQALAQDLLRRAAENV